MGQYHLPVNLDKHEFIHPHKLGDGLKLREQGFGGEGGVTCALLVLLACSNGRGGGDFPNGIEYVYTPNGPPGQSSGGGQTQRKERHPLYGIANAIIGRWAGDRIAIVGDYSQNGDIKGVDTELIYNLCNDEDTIKSTIEHLETLDDDHKATAKALRTAPPYTDISDDLRAYFEAAGMATYDGTGWVDRKTP